MPKVNVFRIGTPREDKKFPENFSIHPWRNANTGRRQVYNTCKVAKKG